MSRHALLVGNALLLLYSCGTPHLLLLYFNMYIHMLYLYAFTPIYALLVLCSCFTSRYTCNCCNLALLKYLYLYSCFLSIYMLHSCFTPALLQHVYMCTYDLLLYVYSSMCMYIYALLVLCSCFTTLDMCNCCNPPLLAAT